MVLAALLLICSLPQTDDAPKVKSDSSSVVSDGSTKDTSLVASLPSMPVPKVNADVESISPRATAQPFEPVKPAFTRPRETARQRKIWYGLAAAGHSGAAFDAWSTRRAISSGAGTESNPFLRPFAHSGALYAATQVSPAFMDFLGKRMMVSQHRWVQRMWWLPQAAGASFSFAAGAHNMGVVH